ncbi:MAG: family 10 glycosylhydrolase, partial [Bacteroidota bacterium]|nr:family 10 glycosylhydrolase [Bacteroidota bacterium]
MRKFLFAFLFIMAISVSYAQEFRGTWLSRDAFASKETLAKTMDSLANNNINVVFINMWSRGYPLWNSKKFYEETGYYIDPNYQGRDLLAEAVAEGHKVGLHVEAWFEYGFVGGWTGNNPPGGKGPIFVKHPSWIARTQNGTEIDNSNFYWMAQANPDAQNFLISLTTEIARNYDIDGIELDRIRYSSLQYGYDSTTIAIYSNDHNGTPPPTNFQDTSWTRWRANNLNQFMARTYDSIKAVNQHINVSNAPSLYSSSSYTSYDSFAQDWYWWVNNNKIDNVQVQSYVGSSISFGNIIDYIKTKVNYLKVFPAFAISPNGSPLALADLYNFVNITRQKGFSGNAIWYYKDLMPMLLSFKENVYQAKSYPPYTSADWRENRDLTSLLNSQNLVKTGEWLLSNVLGYSGQSLYANPGNLASVDYYFNVPASGTYEIYAFVITGSNRPDSAIYKLYDSTGAEIIKSISQSTLNNRRWQKIADLPLSTGRHKVISITNENLAANKVIGADAAMIILNR